MTCPLIPSFAEALEDWRRRIQANRDEVERFREEPERADFYAGAAPRFRPSGGPAEPESTLALLQSMVVPGETWLDIGAGGGRYALPLARIAGEVIAVEPSEAMLGTLEGSVAERAVGNLRVIRGRWPLADPLEADVALTANVLYDVDDIGPFLDAMDASARRRCVVVLGEEPPPTPVDRLWPEIHGVERTGLPGLRELLALLLARGTRFDVTLAHRPPFTYAAVEDAMFQARRHTWVRPGGEKDRRLQAVVREKLIEREGRLSFSWDPVSVGVVTWDPRRPKAATRK